MGANDASMFLGKLILFFRWTGSINLWFDITLHRTLNVPRHWLWSEIHLSAFYIIHSISCTNKNTSTTNLPSSPMNFLKLYGNLGLGLIYKRTDFSLHWLCKNVCNERVYVVFHAFLYINIHFVCVDKGWFMNWSSLFFFKFYFQTIFLKGRYTMYVS